MKFISWYKASSLHSYSNFEDNSPLASFVLTDANSHTSWALAKHKARGFTQIINNFDCTVSVGLWNSCPTGWRQIFRGQTLKYGRSLSEIFGNIPPSVDSNLGLSWEIYTLEEPVLTEIYNNLYQTRTRFSALHFQSLVLQYHYIVAFTASPFYLCLCGFYA